ncbi:MAG: hypothetical protein ACRDO2_09700 [Nocardioidaceae bacterium]
MRSNGLTASSYTPIADIDPRIVGPLLDTLKDHGVAAYVTPVEPSSMGAFDGPEFRTEVRDRLYVDATEADQAKTLIAEVNDEIDTTGEDLAWAQIVSGYDLPMAGESAPWPSSEELATTDESDGSERSAAGGGDGSTEDPGYDEGAARRTPLDDDSARHTAKVRAPEPGDEDRFVPPTPPPLPRLEPAQQVAWLGVIGGPVLLLVSVLFSVHLPGWMSALAVAGFVGGFVGLVLMMGDKDDDDSGWDDGAVV